MPQDSQEYVKCEAAIIFDALATILGTLFVLLWVGGLGGLLFSIIIVPIAVIYTYLLDKSYRYQLKEDGIYIYHGVISRKQSLFLYNKIQDVNESQSLFHRIFGLKNLKISTMTQESQQGGSISGLTTEQATELRGEILSRVSASTKKSGSPASKPASMLTGGPISDAPKFVPSMKTIYPTIALAFLVLVFSIFLGILVGLAAFIIAFFGLLMTVPIAIGTLIYKYYTFLQYDDERIYIKTGWLNVQTTTIPYDRVQDVYLSRGILQRFFGLATVRALTGESMLIAEQKNVPPNEIRGLELEEAQVLRKAILDKVKSDGSDERIIAGMERFPLLPKSYFVRALKICAIFFILSLIGSLFLPAVTDGLISLPIIWGLLAAIFLIVLAFTFMYFKSINYSFTQTTIIMEKGIFTIDRATLPISKVQDVSVSQDLFDRIFGLYDVHISTVTLSSAALLHYDGVSKETAAELKDFLQGMILGKNPRK